MLFVKSLHWHMLPSLNFTVLVFSIILLSGALTQYFFALGDDLIFELNGADIISGFKGNDCIFGGEVDDVIYGDDGYDTLNGNS